MASSSRYRTPSPGPKPADLDLASPEPQHGSSQPPQAPKKRKVKDTLYVDQERSSDEEDSDGEYEEETSKGTPTKLKPATSSSVIKKKPATKKQKRGDGWLDIPLWTDNRCPVASLPGEILDKIFGSSELNLRDHLSLAATCRAFRAPYYILSKSNTPNKLQNPLWEALMVLRPPPNTGRSTRSLIAPTTTHYRLLRHIWTNENKVETDEMRVLWPKARFGVLEKKRQPRTNAERRAAAMDQVAGGAMRSYEWEQAIFMVNSETRVTATEAKSTYKLSEKELSPLPHIERNNPHRGSTTMMRLFVEASVEARSLKLHGGVWGHQQLLDKREATRQKAAATRAKNGTDKPRGRKANSRYRGGWYDDFDGYGYSFNYDMW